MSEARKYRRFSASEKLEVVLASLRGDRSVAEICREHAISETLLRRWREQLPQGRCRALGGRAGALGPGGAAKAGRRA